VDLRAASSHVRPASCVLVGLAASALALALAPIALEPGYSPVAHTTSEAAGQGVRGAWVARLGFVAMGIAVLVLAVRTRGSWTLVARVCHATFGTCMLAAATFSSRPWHPSSFDATQDLLHSVAATAMGFAFVAGVAAEAVHLARRGLGWRALDAIAVVAAVAIPSAMVLLPDAAGLLQRTMFLVAYLWYGREALAVARAVPVRVHQGGRPTTRR
jgi:hypothetical protein